LTSRRLRIPLQGLAKRARIREHSSGDWFEACEEDQLMPRRSQRAKTSDEIYQLKVTLQGIRPPIWRRVQVPDCTLGDLHDLIQVAMGWESGHLHQFEIDGVHYGPQEDDPWVPGGDMKVEDEASFLLSQVLRGTKKFHYEYDFGDGWQHDVLFEKVVGREAGTKYPRCVAGKRACPPEDVGGPWGYADFLAAIADPKHDRHEEQLEWIGGKFDPEAFSTEEVNQDLHTFS
jgi:hypothetical protein